MKTTSTAKKLATIHAKFAKGIVNRLNNYYSREEREDAVAEAFRIMMAEGCPENSCVPRTDEEWRAKIYYRAKGCLSNAISKSKVRAKYVRRAAEEPRVAINHWDPRAALHIKTVKLALDRMLNELCKEHNIQDWKKEVFLSLLNDDPAELVAERHGITKNYAYQIKFRFNRLLSKFGRRLYTRARWEVEHP